MCGICGTVAFAGFANSEAARQRVEAMLQALLHRGADAVGLHAREHAIFGATRLGIRGHVKLFARCSAVNSLH
jgi:asparagine synthetase B (glutamine-hydrolysing)